MTISFDHFAARMSFLISTLPTGLSSFCISASRGSVTGSRLPRPIQVRCGGVLRFTSPGVNISDDNSITQAMLRSGPTTSRMTFAVIEFCMPISMPSVARCGLISSQAQRVS